MNKELVIVFEQDETVLDIQQNQINYDLDNRIKLVPPTTTDEVTHVDSSGQKIKLSNYLNALENSTVPKRLNRVSLIESGDASKQYVYVDNDGQDGKISVADLTTPILKTVDKVPTEIKKDTYILLKI